MTKLEWLNIGYQNNVIDELPDNVPTFFEVYKKWFMYKAGQIREQSLDRMECTYNKYYAKSDIINMKISDISEQIIIDFLNGIFAQYGSITLKEYRKIYQIVNNVLCYALDFNIVGARLLNWKTVNTYCYNNHVVSGKKDTVSVCDKDVETLQHFIVGCGYNKKQSACLMLLLNFYLGLRVGELSALEWSDFDIDNRVLYVSRSEVKKYARLDDGTRGKLIYEIAEPKTENAIRKVPLCDNAIKVYELIKYHHAKMGYNTKRLLYDGADTIGIRSLDRTLTRVCNLCEITKFNTHMIRKTFATKLHHAGVPSRIIADILGHADISTTEKCYILTDLEYFQTVSRTLNSSLVY